MWFKSKSLWRISAIWSCREKLGFRRQFAPIHTALTGILISGGAEWGRNEYSRPQPQPHSCKNVNKVFTNWFPNTHLCPIIMGLLAAMTCNLMVNCIWWEFAGHSDKIWLEIFIYMLLSEGWIGKRKRRKRVIVIYKYSKLHLVYTKR